jgi:hypothetical protein
MHANAKGGLLPVLNFKIKNDPDGPSQLRMKKWRPKVTCKRCPMRMIGSNIPKHLKVHTYS